MRISDPWKSTIEPGDAFAMRDGSVLQVRGVQGKPPDVSVYFVNNRYAQYGEDVVRCCLDHFGDLGQNIGDRKRQSLTLFDEPLRKMRRKAHSIVLRVGLGQRREGEPQLF